MWKVNEKRNSVVRAVDPFNAIRRYVADGSGIKMKKKEEKLAKERKRRIQGMREKKEMERKKKGWEKEKRDDGYSE